MNAGNKPSRSELIEQGRSLVYSACKRFRRSGIEEGELIQEAHVALLEAADKYNPAKGNWLGYAKKSINGALLQYFLRERTIRITWWANHLRRLVLCATQKLEADGCVYPTIAQIAEVADLSLEQVCAVLAKNKQKKESQIDAIEATSSPEVLSNDDPTKVFSHLTIAIIKSSFAKLEPLHQDILVRHLGIDGDPPQSTKEIQRDLGIPRSVIQAITSRSLSDIRKDLQERGWIEDELDFNGGLWQIRKGEAESV